MQIKIPIEEVSYMLFVCFNYCNQRNNLGSTCNGECCISSSPLFPYHNTMETCVLLLVFFCIFKKIIDKGECLMDKCL